MKISVKFQNYKYSLFITYYNSLQHLQSLLNQQCDDWL